MTGLAWLDETGMMHTPIGITNTNSVGIVRDAIAAYSIEQTKQGRIPASIASSWDGTLPIAAETWDGWLNDITAFQVTKEHAHEALTTAKSGHVAERNVGGGTGMICHEFKGGIGTSSRLIDSPSGRYTVGVLVQTNYGSRSLLRIDGVPIGRELDFERVPSPWLEKASDGSIIVIIATDAPLLPIQCKRLAKRATVGLARVGGMGNNGSGDIFLAFATGNHLSVPATTPYALKMIPHDHLDSFFEGVAESVEEAILNALTAAETMVGWKGHMAYALPLGDLQRIMKKYRS